jgi:hypothetical protein
MGNKLDVILLEELIDTPTTVNTDFETESVDISFAEGNMSIQLDYDNGSTVDMTVQVSVSNDNVTFVPVDDTIHTITDASGTSFMDIDGSGAVFMRVEIVVTTGSIDVQKISYRAKRRH